MSKLATRKPIKRSKPPGAPKRKARGKTPGTSAKGATGRSRHPSSVLMWLSGKVLTTILPALFFGIGLGIVIGYWLDPEDKLPISNVAIENSVQTRSVPRPESIPSGPVLVAPEQAPQKIIPTNTAPMETVPTETVQTVVRIQLNDEQVVALPTVSERSAPAPTITKKKQWLANAVISAVDKKKPAIALVIDDVGVDLKRARRAVALKGPLTIAIMTYANDITALASTAHLNGHELMVHVPMEPVDLSSNAGPNVLLTSHESGELMRRLEWALTRFDGYVGINNHMGSRFTAWEPGMRLVLAELNKRGLLYLDSPTSSESKAGQVARKLSLPFASRDVFLDNDPTPDAVRQQIVELEEIAKRYGYAVGIGHPHDATIEVLSEWLLHAEERGFVLVPISAIVQRRLAKS